MSKYWEEQMWENDDVVGLEKLIALALARLAGEDGRAWPSAKTLANATGTSVNTSARALKSLEDAGVVTRLGGDAVAHLGSLRTVVYQFQESS